MKEPTSKRRVSEAKLNYLIANWDEGYLLYNWLAWFNGATFHVYSMCNTMAGDSYYETTYLVGISPTD